MLPRERVFAALEHREPDRIPWGEHSIDYNVYEDILGRKTLVQAKMRTTQAYWDGRRDEVVESYKRDRLDLIRAVLLDRRIGVGKPQEGGVDRRLAGDGPGRAAGPSAPAAASRFGQPFRGHDDLPRWRAR